MLRDLISLSCISLTKSNPGMLLAVFDEQFDACFRTAVVYRLCDSVNVTVVHCDKDIPKSHYHLTPYRNRDKKEIRNNEQENGRAPTYNALFNEVAELCAQLQQLQDVINRSFSTDIVNTQPVSDLRIMPDLNQSVKKFTGRENVVEATDWLDTVESLANLNNLPWNFRLQFIRANLTSAARSWMGVSDHWDLMKTRVQNRDEPILEFYLDKVRLCKDLSLHFSEIRYHVLQSLYSQDLALYALGRTHKNSIELLADLQDWQRLTDLRNTRFAADSSQLAGRCKTKLNRV
ncbi:hypothetical protein QTP88_026715 [Uroleucon formosanum]